MNDIERLIALDYVRKRIDAEIKTLRKDVQAHYHDRMTHEVDRDGEPRRSFGYYLGDKKLATFWFPTSEPEPERRELVATCYDSRAALSDDNEEFAEWLAAYMRQHIVELSEQYVRETGDQLDGVFVEEKVTPGKPPAIEPMRFRINTDRISEAMRPQLPSVVAGLLEGGDAS